MQFFLLSTVAGPNWYSGANTGANRFLEWQQAFAVSAGMHRAVCARWRSLQQKAQCSCSWKQKARASISYQLKPVSRWAWFKLTEVIAKISSTFSGPWTSPAQSNSVSVGVGDGRHPAFFPLCELTEPFVCVSFLQDGLTCSHELSVFVPDFGILGPNWNYP